MIFRIDLLAWRLGRANRADTRDHYSLWRHQRVGKYRNGCRGRRNKHLTLTRPTWLRLSSLEFLQRPTAQQTIRQLIRASSNYSRDQHLEGRAAASSLPVSWLKGLGRPTESNSRVSCFPPDKIHISLPSAASSCAQSSHASWEGTNQTPAPPPASTVRSVAVEWLSRRPEKLKGKKVDRDKSDASSKSHWVR